MRNAHAAMELLQAYIKTTNSNVSVLKVIASRVTCPVSQADPFLPCTTQKAFLFCLFTLDVDRGLLIVYRILLERSPQLLNVPQQIHERIIAAAAAHGEFALAVDAARFAFASPLDENPGARQRPMLPLALILPLSRALRAIGNVSEADALRAIYRDTGDARESALAALHARGLHFALAS
jgi:hypothetical protein